MTIVLRRNVADGRVEGQAHRVIANLPLTTANYSVAWELLKLHFGNEDAII
jgi:hypothetical protein